jgi:drug/metabolite transporter (DMT)-like permease
MILPRLLLLFTVVVWGCTFVATKILVQYVNPAELLGLRMIIGLPILLVVVLTKRLKFDFTAKQHLNLLIGSAVITLHFLIQITGIKYTTATNTGWLISTTPLILAVLSFLFLKERIGRNTIIGIGMATFGVILLMSKGDISSIGWLESVGDWLVLASAFTWAIYTALTRDISRAKDPVAVTFAILLPTGIIVVGYMLAASDWSKFVHLPLDGVVALLFLGVLGTALGHWFWQEGVAKIGAAKAGIFLYLEPVATTCLAVPYLKEPFGVATAAGGLLVLAGVIYAERRSAK